MPTQIHCYLFFCILLQLQYTSAGIVPFSVVSKVNLPAQPYIGEQLGYITYLPNGTLILRSPHANGTKLENLLLLKNALGPLKWQPDSKWNIKIYGEGVEHKFPPFFEQFLQRIQSYFSVYKYTDTSRPGAYKPATQQTASMTTPSSTTGSVAIVTSSLAIANTNALGAGDGSGGASTTPLYLHVNGVDNAHEEDEYTEFISIGENDGFITVGED